MIRFTGKQEGSNIKQLEIENLKQSAQKRRIQRYKVHTFLPGSPSQTPVKARQPQTQEKDLKVQSVCGISLGIGANKKNGSDPTADSFAFVEFTNSFSAQGAIRLASK